MGRFSERLLGHSYKLVIYYWAGRGGGGGGATKWENRGSNTFCARTPQDRIKLVAPPPFKEWTFFVPPPLSQYG